VGFCSALELGGHRQRGAGKDRLASAAVAGSATPAWSEAAKPNRKGRGRPRSGPTNAGSGFVGVALEWVREVKPEAPVAARASASDGRNCDTS